MRTQIREIRFDAGEYMRVQLAPIRRPGGRPSGRRPKGKTTPEVQQALNAKNAVRKFTDLIHRNFTPDDWALHPTYSDDKLPANTAEANHNMQLFLRRVKREYKKVNGTTEGFKYIFVTSQSSTGRIHHHVVLSCKGVPIEKVVNKWGVGRTSPKHLEFDEDGVCGLAAYYTKSQDLLTQRSWYCSNGLERVDPRYNDSRWSVKDMEKTFDETPDLEALAKKYYPGWTIRKAEPIATFGGSFVEIFLYKTDNKFFHYDKFGRRYYKFACYN